jgi:hypothetical protein
MDSTMNKEDLYHDYMLIRNMRAPTSKRTRMLGELLSLCPDHWQVIGITEDALRVFAEHNYKKVSRMGINRSHLVDRHKTYTTMIDEPLMKCEDWWEFYRKNDTTILATSSENMTNSFSKIYDIDTSLGLFQSRGFAWKHNKEEISFLKEQQIQLQ